jgi:toxin ParE1/3/4
MSFQVRLTEDALRDLEELDDYISAHDGQEKADYLLSQVESAILKLADFPERGNHPPELAALGIREYRETFFRPYRIIYRVVGKKVHVYLIADGRRDMQALLARRLLRQ